MPNYDLSNFDAFVNAFFDFNFPPWKPEIEALRAEYRRAEENLKLQGQNCCGTKNNLIRAFVARLKEVF